MFTPLIVKISSLDPVVGAMSHVTEVTWLNVVTYGAKFGRECLHGY